MRTRLKIFDPYKLKHIIVGEISDGIFRRRVNKRHYFKMLKSYGIQENVFQELVKKGIKRLVFEANSVKYESLLEDWLSPDIKVLDYGWGKQRFLPIERMRRTVC